VTNDRTSQYPEAIVYRLMQAKDVPDVLTLMTQSQFPVSGLVSRSIYSSLCLDALSDERVIIGVATEEKQVAAFLLVIVNWSTYWRSFALRHPLSGARITWRRLYRKRKSEDTWPRLSQEDKKYISSIVSPEPSGKSWSDSSATIAKGVFMQVDPKFRGRRISVGLYQFVMRLLADSGINRIDAKVDLTNRRAMPLHLSVGYRLERDGNSLFATMELNK